MHSKPLAFTKPYQVVTIEVPYDTGMNPYSGLLKVAVEMGLVDKRGSRYAIAGAEKSWYEREFGEYAEGVLAAAEDNREKFIEGILEEDEVEAAPDSDESVKTRRIENAQSK